MKIILSGGWGYGNIGDELILSSTINWLREKYPEANIIILTYSKLASNLHSFNDKNISLEYCLHKKIDLDNSKYKFTRLDSDVTKSIKIKNIVTQFITDNKLYCDIATNKKKNTLQEIFRSSDMYFMCGGGYFNERWLSKVYSQISELELAQKLNIKTHIIGPTIGEIPETLRSKVSKIFNNVENIYVRDQSSQKTLESINVNSIVTPDIALSDWDVEHSNKLDIEEIGIVFTTLKSNMKEELRDSLVTFQNKMNTKLNFKLIITRTWKRDLKATYKLLEELSLSGINSKLIIPSDHIALEKEMISCDLVISENLHGLISATRNLIPIIAINDYPANSPNGKKFRGFLSQFDIEDFYISSKTKEGKLLELLEKIDSEYQYLKNNIDVKRKEIRGTYMELLNKFT